MDSESRLRVRTLSPIRTMRPITLPRFALARACMFALASSRIAPAQTSRPPAPRFTVVEASIDDMRKALEQRRTTSREIVQQYLTRIALYEDRINAVIAVNPNALAEADARDRERAAGR